MSRRAFPLAQARCLLPRHRQAQALAQGRARPAGVGQSPARSPRRRRSGSATTSFRSWLSERRRMQRGRWQSKENRTCTSSRRATAMRDAVRTNGSPRICAGIISLEGVDKVQTQQAGIQSRTVVAVDGERVIPDRCGTVGPRSSCCPDPSHRARAASVPRGRGPCPPALTIRRFGCAIGEAARICRAMETSSRCGLSAQAAVKALAVERLIPA